MNDIFLSFLKNRCNYPLNYCDIIVTVFEFILIVDDLQNTIIQLLSSTLMRS